MIAMAKRMDLTDDQLVQLARVQHGVETGFLDEEEADELCRMTGIHPSAWRDQSVEWLD